jgi:hypothetical protein
LVEDAVELDVGRAQEARQRARERRLARPRASDDGDPFDLSAPVRSA